MHGSFPNAKLYQRANPNYGPSIALLEIGLNSILTPHLLQIGEKSVKSLCGSHMASPRTLSWWEASRSYRQSYTLKELKCWGTSLIRLGPSKVGSTIRTPFSRSVSNLPTRNWGLTWTCLRHKSNVSPSRSQSFWEKVTHGKEQPTSPIPDWQIQCWPPT